MNKKERNERTLNRTDAKPCLSDVYKKRTRAKTRQEDVRLSGRSMVEMLGVLAIIGVLSVGAISGYSRAMEKYRLNKTITGYSQLLVHLFEFRNNYIQQDNVYLASYLQKMNSVPEGMYVKGEFLYDSLGRRNRIFTREKRIVFDYFLTDVSQSGENDIEFCRLVFQNLIIPYSNIIYSVSMYMPQNTSPATKYGDEKCRSYSSQQCLRNMSLENIYSFCQSCLLRTNQDSNCILVITV